VNAVSSISAFMPAERFDAHVARAFAADPATRHTRDRLIAEVHAGASDRMLLRAAPGLEALPEADERRAAVNAIDFAFEPLVLPGLSVAQAVAYFAAVEDTLRVGEAAGLDGPGPLWVDTVHHACVFSVMFQLAAHLRRHRGCDRVVLLHQGARPEPRLEVVANLLARVHGVGLARLPLRGRWFHELARTATPQTAIFYLADMPADGAGVAAGRRGRARLDLHAGPGLGRRVDAVSGSAAFARRLGASHVVLDYPAADRIRLRPFDPDRPPACPLVDWVFWPVLVPGAAAAVAPPAA
jgi:hypothetical protein